jgi:hypothetical protein
MFMIIPYDNIRRGQACQPNKKTPTAFPAADASISKLAQIITPPVDQIESLFIACSALFGNDLE